MSAFNFPPCYPKLRLLFVVLHLQADTSGSINRTVSKQIFQLYFVTYFHHSYTKTLLSKFRTQWYTQLTTVFSCPN